MKLKGGRLSTGTRFQQIAKKVHYSRGEGREHRPRWDGEILYCWFSSKQGTNKMEARAERLARVAKKLAASYLAVAWGGTGRNIGCDGGCGARDQRPKRE